MARAWIWWYLPWELCSALRVRYRMCVACWVNPTLQRKKGIYEYRWCLNPGISTRYVWSGEYYFGLRIRRESSDHQDAVLLRMHYKRLEKEELGGTNTLTPPPWHPAPAHIFLWLPQYKVGRDDRVHLIAARIKNFNHYFDHWFWVLP